MVFVSLSCTVSVQETSSLKQSTLRTSLAPPKGARRSLDVCAHVLATQVTSPDTGGAASLPGQAPAAVRVEALPQTNWTKALQTKFSSVWEKWQKLSAQISQYKALRPDWVAQTQGLLDQHFQRFLSSVGAAGHLAGSAPATRTAAAGSSAGTADLAAARPPVTLTPYLTVADDVEVSFAAMLSDLCNMAYDVEQIDPELLEARHHLSLIATSLTSGSSCSTAVAAAYDSGSEAEGAQVPQPAPHPVAAPIPGPALAGESAPAAVTVAPDTGSHAASQRHGVVSFTMGGSPPLSPSISMLQLTSPEAVTAALTSQGHGAAFARPVYISSLYQALTSMGSYEEEGDISDLELRAAMAAAGAGPHALLIGGGGGAAANIGVGSLGTMGTFATLDEIPTALLYRQQQQQAALGQQGAKAPPVLAGDAGEPLVAAAVAMGGGMAGYAGPGGLGASGTLISDVQLSEDRDFVAGMVYGYNTQPVERRRSNGGGAEGDGAALPVAAVTQSGAAGGRALREEQEGRRRRRSSSGGDGGISGWMGGGSAEGRATGAAAAVAEAAGSMVDGGVSPVAGGPPVVVACTKAPPNAWFTCDDKLTRTRYFAIQGSTSLEHWQINLQFEPVVFENPKYGVRIHRGVYEAAKVLYDDLLPLVQQHLETSPYATVSFAGHSLGGSLATVLMLLFVTRGVLKPSNISPVYTFGAPAVFCQGAVAEAPSDRCAKCNLSCEMRPGAPDTAAAAGGAASTVAGAGGPLSSIVAVAASMEQVQVLPLGLMASLGLHDDQVVNVIMHKDVVPRAFVCDYTALAGMLQRWWPSFRDVHSLQDGAGPHKSLYNFVGRVAVLRPQADLPFVNGPADASHPMLPNHAALYRVGVHDDLLPSLDYAAASMASWEELLGGPLSAIASMGGCRRPTAAAAARRAAKLEGMQQSVMQFMNQPHPLATLSDYQAYGPQGFISRFHNPDNYTRALSALTGR